MGKSGTEARKPELSVVSGARARNDHGASLTGWMFFSRGRMPKAGRRKAGKQRDLEARKPGVVGGVTTKSGIVMSFNDGSSTSSPAPKTSSADGSPSALRTASGIRMEIDD
jgi:hypothetical protein